MIKLYIHYGNLKAFMEGKWINAKFQYVGPNDIEVLVPIDDIVTEYQTNGFTIRKKKWYEKLIPFIYFNR